MNRYRHSGDSTSKRVLDVLESFLSETVEDHSTVHSAASTPSALDILTERAHCQSAKQRH